MDEETREAGNKVTEKQLRYANDLCARLVRTIHLRKFSTTSQLRDWLRSLELIQFAILEHVDGKRVLTRSEMSEVIDALLLPAPICLKRMASRLHRKEAVGQIGC